MSPLPSDARGPLKLEPIPVARPWGGDALARRYGKPVPEDGAPLGESWEASDVEHRLSRVASGPHRGRPLPEVLGAPLPLLIKLLDCRETLSLQVHPDEEAAAAIGGGARPKTEAWHILAADPDAHVFTGAAPGVTTEALIDACRAGDPAPLLRKIHVVTGDTIFVPAGTVHAIGPGLVLYEVQQPSDTTYRMHDWGRRGLDGKPRALHLDEAGRAIRLLPRADPRREPAFGPGPRPRIALVRSPAFGLDLVLCDAGEVRVAPRDRVSFVTAAGGDGTIVSAAGEEPIRAGETFAIPPGTAYGARGGPRGLRLLDAFPGEAAR